MSTLFSQKEVENKKNRVRITYNPRVTSKLKSTFEKENMQLVHSVPNKLGAMLGSTKDKTNIEDKSGIYELTCTCLDQYIGQTRRRISTRVNEHKNAIKRNQPTKSAVAAHAIEKLHLNISSLNFKVKKVVNNPALLDAYESYFIHNYHKKNPNSNLMNTDNGNISSYLFNCV